MVPPLYPSKWLADIEQVACRLASKSCLRLLPAMGEQWIDAATACRLAGNSHSLCTRLHAGIVTSRARLLLIGERRSENAMVPANFWWADGHEALDQNWETGDFSTWIEGREHWQAFGLTFALSEILEMVPVERRGIVARSLSVASNGDWVTAKEARRFAYEQGGVNPTVAGNVVLKQAQLGFVTARAVLAQGDKSNMSPVNWTWDAREWDVAGWFWDSFVDASKSSHSWDEGTFEGRGAAPNGLRRVRLTGVYFLRESLDALLPSGKVPAVPPPTLKSVGGRLPAAFSDDLLCAIWALIYRGELIPKLQADVVDAMLDWASQNGHEIGVTLAKEKARKVFAAYSN